MSSLSDKNRTMTDSELDAVYTSLCETMTRLGEPLYSKFLARFSLLAIDCLADANTARRLIAAAAEDLGGGAVD